MNSPYLRTIDGLHNVIKQSYMIQTHQEYYEWLQHYVSSIIPHHALLACWGNYGQKRKSQKLSYDIASAIPKIKTQTIIDYLQEADLFMHSLYKAWCQNNRRWFVVNDIQKLNNNHPFKPNFLLDQANLNAFLVYGVSDIRTDTQCLYVFFTKQAEFQARNIETGYIMPHIDNVLRSIQHIHQIEESQAPINNVMLGMLTKKELEILDLLKFGQCNKEISQKLNISPNTTKAHLSQMFRKLNVTNRTQAVNVYSNI